MTQSDLPKIPQKITVHLGSPDSDAPNITLDFVDYIKNIASGEINPTWHENAIKANILALISFTLNRIYTEYYPAQGYDFDITNDISTDPDFVYDRENYQNISQIVDEMSNQYISRKGEVEPLFARYCDGVEVLCPGLSKWGSEQLAEEGKTPREILENYYGDDIRIITDTPIENINTPPLIKPLNLGSWGNDVKSLQMKLNRIGYNFPTIPKIQPLDGVFSYSTQDAVKEFQRIFGLESNGVVSNTTWNRINELYNAVKSLNTLNNKGLEYKTQPIQFHQLFRGGESGTQVGYLQYLLSYLAQFNNKIQKPNITDNYDSDTRSAVISFQNAYGLTPDGIVGPLTYAALYDAYRGAVLNVDQKYMRDGSVPFKGERLLLGTASEEVRMIQSYLNYIANIYTEIPSIPVIGYYGFQTQNAVTAFKRLFNIEPYDGIVDEHTWNEISSLYSDLLYGNTVNDGQFPGQNIG